MITPEQRRPTRLRRTGISRRRRGMRLLAITLAAGFALATPSIASTSSGAAPRAATPVVGASTRVPVYAYFYQWYERSSWKRAKKDFPLAGQYSSDDPHVLRNQVQQAQSAGINGFLTSWKSTPTLNRRLTLLLNVARTQHLDVGVVYEALDFGRSPLRVKTVQADMLYLVKHWGTSLRSSYYGRPVIIWTGTDQYSLADVGAVRKALGNSAYLLAASKSVAGYERVANAVDGEAYYWSSANPYSTSTQRKLNEMGAAVHSHHGIWIAPAAGGFDGTTLGHTRIIDRQGGKTLIRSLDNAYQSKPDAVGVISWNEWSENTYIEPGEHYGSQDLIALGDYLHRRNGVSGTANAPIGPSRSYGNWSGLTAAVVLAFITAIGVALLSLRVGRTGSNRRSGLDEELQRLSERAPSTQSTAASGDNRVAPRHRRDPRDTKTHAGDSSGR